MELADHLIVMGQRFVHQGTEAHGVLGQHPCPLLEGEALGAVAAGVGHVAGEMCIRDRPGTM